MTFPTRFLAIDEEGYVLFDEVRVTDEDVGLEILESLQRLETGSWVATSGGETAFVEAFDEPLVATNISRDGKIWKIEAPYGFSAPFDPASLKADEWDRFHGVTEKGTAFIFSRAAQNTFFRSLDEFDDESVTIDGNRFEIPPLYDRAEKDVDNPDWWTSIYHESGRPGWDLAAPVPELKEMLPRLKLNKSRVLVLGCGEGHDAAEFAREGHIVTAVDFSAEALSRAKTHYGALKNVTWVQSDVFELGPEYDNSFDVIFEHTCFCAIDPERRTELVKLWKRALVPGGHLMGVFFAVHKLTGPPFGSSEWELRERLKKHFRFIFWGRWRRSLPRRQGGELFVYAQSLKA